MPTLSNPELNITLDTGHTDTAIVTASVDVTFTEQEKEVMTAFPSVNYLTTCKLWGADSGFTGADDGLAQLGNAVIRSDQAALPFSRNLSRGGLNEDSGDDEIYARFTCVPGEDTPFVLKSATPVNSAEVTGSF